jgi:hypothetical protein
MKSTKYELIKFTTTFLFRSNRTYCPFQTFAADFQRKIQNKTKISKTKHTVLFKLFTAYCPFFKLSIIQQKVLKKNQNTQKKFKENTKYESNLLKTNCIASLKISQHTVTKCNRNSVQLICLHIQILYRSEKYVLF